MYTRFTITNVLLALIAAIVGSLLVICKSHYWETIDAFALPFYNAPEYSSIERSSPFTTLYSVIIQYIDSAKSYILDTIITNFGYDISAPFIYIFGVIFVISITYLLLKYKNTCAYIPLIVLIIFGSLFASIKPGVTIEQVGQAISAEHSSAHTDINYVALLRNEEYSELDVHLKKMDENFKSNDIGEYAYIEQFKIFETASEEDLAYFNSWLDTTDEKKYALLARGVVYFELGWYARGGKLAKDTPEKQFMTMKEYFRKSTEDMNAVLDIDNKSIFSHLCLISMAAASNLDYSKEEYFNRGIKEFPASHVLASQYMNKLQPKWGGTYQLMRTIAKRMREQAVNNPMLITLGNKELQYRAEKLELNESDAVHRKLTRFSMLYGTTVQEVVNESLHYDSKNDNKNALNVLSYGLKLFPDNSRLLLHRAYHYTIDDNLEFATMDIGNIIPDDIVNAWESDRAALVYTQLHQPEKAIPFYARSIELDPKNDHSYNRLYWLSYKKFVEYKEVLPYMKQWTEVYPESSDAWISYASTLENINENSSVPAYKQFLKYADRNSSIDMNAIVHVEKLINTIEAKLE